MYFSFTKTKQATREMRQRRSIVLIEGHHNYMEFRNPRWYVPIEGQRDQLLALDRQENRGKKEKAAQLVWRSDVATPHCLHSFGKPSPCLAGVSTTTVFSEILSSHRSPNQFQNHLFGLFRL